MSPAAPVERVRIADQLEISRVVTGLWQIADMERDGKELDLDAAATAMEEYVEAGLTTFDMADHYGSAELIAGRFVARHGHKDVELLTKWVPAPGPVTRDDVRAAVQRALDRLQTDHLDLLQFHAWNYADPGYLDSLFWLQELRDEGLIRHLGFTNTDAAHLRLVLQSGIDIAANQVCYSLVDRRAGGAMTDLCRARSVGLLAFGTLLGGFLTERWLDQPDPAIDSLSTWSQMKYRRFIDEAGGWKPFQELLRVVVAAAKQYGVSAANVATRAILDQGATAVLVGARLAQSAHVADTLRVFGLELDEATRSAIARAQGALTAIPGDCGDEYRKPPFLTASGDLSHHLEEFPKPYPTREGTDGHTRVLTGTTWETVAGFSRAIRTGDRVEVSGTTASHGERSIGGDDPAAQTHFVLDKIEGALQSLDSRLEDVVRTRIYVRDVADWEVVARVHGARFGDTRPANTLVEAKLVDPAARVEIEAVAVDRPQP